MKTSKPNKPALPVKVTYSFDSHLMYLIQDVTKKDTVDIIAFFSDLAKAVAHTGMEKRRGDGVCKKIVDYFPGTSIPFFLRLEGRKMWDRQSDLTKGENTFVCTADITFPADAMRMSEEQIAKISEALMERELLGWEGLTLPPFDKPESKTPKMYKKLMEAVCGKKITRVKTNSYDPDISGRCRNCGGNHPTTGTYSGCYCGKT